MKTCRLLQTSVFLLVVIVAGVPAAPAQTPPAKKTVQADDSNARPPVTKNDLAIVRLADQILDSETRWNRADTRFFPDTAKTFSLYCAWEKASKEVDTFEHRSGVR